MFHWPLRWRDGDPCGLEHPQDLFGLYEGVPLVARRIDDVLLPERITIFRGPILAACSRPEEVAVEVLATVRHEVAHFLGWSRRSWRGWRAANICPQERFGQPQYLAIVTVMLRES
ncbi:MAG: metallopeptidase family protein [Chloroflexi bacterium]|nr:metallopeptidase family protein [Chloroflexota bacterium]